MTDDDWAPLPPDQRGLHPGEIVDVRKNASEPMPPPPAAAAPRARPRDPAAEAAAERALAELKNKLAHSAPAKSLIAEVQHRELREQRKKKNLQAAAVRALTHHVANVAPAADPVWPEPELEPAVTAEEAAAADIDPREKEPWFLELPKKEQERLRTHWWYERHRHDDEGVKLRRRLCRAVGYGALLCFVVGVLLAPLSGSWLLILRLTAAGALAAGLAQLAGGGRFRYAIAGGLGFTVAVGLVALMQPPTLFGLMLTTYGMATLGMDGEMRKTGGFGDG